MLLRMIEVAGLAPFLPAAFIAGAYAGHDYVNVAHKYDWPVPAAWDDEGGHPGAARMVSGLLYMFAPIWLAIGPPGQAAMSWLWIGYVALSWIGGTIIGYVFCRLAGRRVPALWIAGALWWAVITYQMIHWRPFS